MAGVHRHLTRVTKEPTRFQPACYLAPSSQLTVLDSTTCGNSCIHCGQKVYVILGFFVPSSVIFQDILFEIFELNE